MARRKRRTGRRGYRSSGLLLLVVLLLGAFILLYLLSTGRIDAGSLNRPITGPRIELPAVALPLAMGKQPDSDGASFTTPSKTSGCALQGSLPDPDCTPGAVTGVTKAQVCAANAALDPGAEPDTAAIFAAYTVPDDGSYAIDHLVPVALGGTNSPANLWPIPANDQPGPVEKDAAETALRAQVCGGSLSLAEAQRQIAANWQQFYNTTP